MSEIGKTELVSQLRALGVEKGDILLVHTAFRKVGPVEEGPLGLIAALREALGPQGTLAMPSWSGNDDEPFDKTSSPATPDLGVTADMFWRLAGICRSDHVHAFAAAGPAAETIVADPLPLPPHIPASPVGRVHDLDGKILLLGTDHSSNTTLHLAELLAEVPYRSPSTCTILENGVLKRIEYDENNHCCIRFALADDWLRDAGLQREGRVGHAEARLMRSRDLARLALQHLSKDRLLFLHQPEDGCAECDEARASISPAG